MFSEPSGGPVLALAALLLAGHVTLGLAPVLPVYLVSWLLLGFGMGFGLYDPPFAALAHLYGAEARAAITTLTLWGGFASTVCWPLSALLVEHFGRRGACFAYAGLHLAVTLQLILVFIPSRPALPATTGTSSAVADPLSGKDRRVFLLFGGVLVLGGASMSDGRSSGDLLTRAAIIQRCDGCVAGCEGMSRRIRRRLPLARPLEGAPTPGADLGSTNPNWKSAPGVCGGLGREIAVQQPIVSACLGSAADRLEREADQDQGRGASADTQHADSSSITGSRC